MKHIESIKGAVLFTDIKDFTLKTSLLTQKQITIFLNKQDEIILPIVSKYFGKIVKSIGDSYMIVFETAKNAVLSSIDIQKELEIYNGNIDFNLYKIELRISIDYGVIEREYNNKIEDYFGTTVNIASRLQDKTPENKIFVTKNIIENIQKDDIKSGEKKENIECGNIKNISMGKTAFKGILYEVEIYEIIFQENKNIKIENNKNINKYLLTNENKEKIKEIDSMIFNFSSVAALLGIQPIPFLDSYSVLPFHIYMLNEIAKKYEIKITREEAKEILTTILGSVGVSYIFSQGVVGISKMGTFGLGGYIMIPLNFGLTYAIGKILSLYFYKKTQGVKATNEELKNLFKYSVKSGREIAKKDKSKIVETGIKYKDLLKNKYKKTK